jgi:spermidine/putrescine transport system ATP-binding protein
MVEIRNVTKRFGSFTAVDSVSLSIRAGEFLTLLGPSGCGKTTLLRMVSGFETPDAGTIHLDGHDVTALPPYRRDVNQVFQSYALFPHLSVADNVAYGLRVRRVPRAERLRRVAAAVEMVSLAGMEQRKPHELSGGQRQRVALARALVCEPKVLLLDEPLAALDAKLRRTMQTELKRLQARVGITFVFVTHDQDEAMTMSDRVAVMTAGRVAQLGTPADVYHHPATAYVATFLGQANLLPCRVVDRAVGAVRTSDGLALACDPAALPAADEVLLMVRPERLRLSVDPAAGGFAVTVVDRVFRGPVEQLALRTAGGVELIATGSDLPPSADLFCQVPADAAVVVQP